MHPFKDYFFSWWQLGLLKISMIVAGILVGVYLIDWFSQNWVMILLWIIFILPVIYLATIGLKQVKE